MRGQCLCNTVAFEIDAASLRLYRCHCSLCRRQSGTGSNLATIVPSKMFRWLCGEDKIASWQKESGFRSDFCSVCGSPVPNPLRSTSKTWIPAGLLEAQARVEVVADIYVASRADWDPSLPIGAQFDELPEFKEFLALLHGGAASHLEAQDQRDANEASAPGGPQQGR